VRSAHGPDTAMSPTRVFGAELLYYRSAAGLTQGELGARIYCSGDLISKIEMGQRGPTEEFATACDAVPELATGGGLSRLREHLRGHFKARVFPGWFVGWPDKEAQARILRWFELAVVPGLLQTEGYARALLAGRVLSADDTDEVVAARMERQAILARDDPPELWVVVDEAVLHRGVGDAGVMRDQVDRLIEAAGRPKVVLQVIPATVAVHDGLPGAGFIIADFDGAPSSAYQDTALRGQVIEDSDDIAALMATWDRLRAEALPRRASLDLMEEVAKSWT
jgi:hypothetical protein